MINYTHPGVYIDEIPNAPTVQGASTSVPAFIGTTESIGWSGGKAAPVDTPILITSWGDYQRTFGGFAWRAYVSFGVFDFFRLGGGRCYVVNAKGSTAPTKKNIAGLDFYAVSPGVWSGNLNIILTAFSGGSYTLSVGVALNLTECTDPILASYIEHNTFPITNDNLYYVLESYGGFRDDVTSLQALADRVNAASIFIRIGPVASAALAAGTTKLDPGTDGGQSFGVSAELVQGIQDVSLIALPDLAVTSPASQGTVINTVLSKICELPNGSNFFYAVDPPFGLSKTDVAVFKQGGTMSDGTTTTSLNSRNGAIYYPWIHSYNPISGKNVPVPPSPSVLGRYAYTDNAVGVYASPAGVINGALRTVPALERYLSDSDQDTLNPIGVNVIRNFLSYGNVIYGARTLDATGQRTYVATQRLLAFIERSLSNSLQSMVFAPNNESLWGTVTREIDAFLTFLFQQGALFGTTPSEAFFVVCDKSNNPPEDMQRGILNVNVGVAPSYPAEFVVLHISQKMAGPTSRS